MVYGSKINHTVIEGKRLIFTGSAIGLFGNWVKWLLFIIITLGIYGFWLGIALEKWKVKNTTLLNQKRAIHDGWPFLKWKEEEPLQKSITLAN